MKIYNFPGTFVTVEGIDGSGKGTLIENLQTVLGDSWEFTQEPSHGKYGRIIREELQSESDPTTSDFFLFCADRIDHIQSLIGPRLEEGTNVICDRYNLSTYAYQAPVVKQDIISRSGIDYINSVLSEWAIVPDVTLLLDAPVDECLERVDGGSEKYEKVESLRQARRIYQTMSEERSEVYTIDGTMSRDDVLQEALAVINEAES